MSRKHHSNNSGEGSKKDCDCNVGEVERVLSAVGGGILVLKGLKSGSTFGLLSAALGAASLYRAATGSCPLYKTLNINTNTDAQKLTNVAEQAKEIGANVAEQAKTLATNAAEKAKSFSDETRNRISDAIATK